MGGPLGELIWTRRYAFQAVHALNSTALRERRHGHEFFVEVSFTGKIDEADEIMQTQVIDRLHHRELTAIDPATGEHIVNWIHERLLKTALAPRLKAVALQETKKNRFISAMTEPRYV